MTKLRVLVLTDREIFPPTDGETYAMAGQVSELTQHGDVDLLYVRRPSDVTSLEGLKAGYGLRHVFEAGSGAHSRPWVRAGRELCQGRPYFMVPPCGPKQLGMLAASGRYDVVYTGLPRLLGWLPAVSGLLASCCLRIVCVNDAITERFRFHRALAALPLSSPLRLRNLLIGLRSVYFGPIERKLLAGQDLILVQSDLDRTIIGRDCGSETADRVVVFPNGHKGELMSLGYAGEDSRQLLFVGTIRGEQFGLLQWFVVRVLRPLRELVEDVGLEVVGDISPNHRAALDRLGMVTVRGFVPDLAEAFSGKCMMVCPSFMRGGLLNKVLDAMTAGVPCSGIGAFNGFMGFQNGVHGLSVTNAAEWVRVLADVLRAPERLLQISTAARELASRMSWDANAAEFRRRLRDLLAVQTTHARPPLDRI